MLYTPPHFNVDDRALAAELVRTHPFATLITSAEEPIVTHLPLLLIEQEGAWQLLGHVARANPHWQSWETHSRVLAIFHGGDAYISPSLYTTKKAVPTWNYALVHVHGTIEATHDSDAKERVLKALIDRHDTAYHQQWDELDAEFREGMKKGIVAFSIEVDRVDAKFKLSQNRPAEDRTRVLQAMQAGDAKQRLLAQWTAALAKAD